VPNFSDWKKSRQDRFIYINGVVPELPDYEETFLTSERFCWYTHVNS